MIDIVQGGAASDEELAAIVAAIVATSDGPGPEPSAPRPSRWRFAGRWWSAPVPLQRRRPR